MTATMAPPHPVNTSVMTRKQRKYYLKYKDAPPEDLTQNIRDSWTRRVPTPLNCGPIKMVGITIVLLVSGSIVGVLLGTPDMSGLYYLLTQTNADINAAWHALLPDGIRHSIRDSGIGVMAGLWIVFVIRNRYRPLKPLTRFDKLEMRLHIGRWYFVSNIKDDRHFSVLQLISSSLLVLPYAAFGFGLGHLIIFLVTDVAVISNALEQLFGWLIPYVKEHSSGNGVAIVERIQASLVDKWPGKLIGLLMAFFFGRRPVKGTMDDIQLWLVQQRFVRNIHAGHPELPAPWYYLPNWRATYNDVKSEGTHVAGNHGLRSVWTMRLVVAASFALAIYGWYVLLFIVHG